MNLLIPAVALLAASGASAAAITNLSHRPQEITTGVGEASQPVTIAPYATWRVPGKAVVRYRGQEVHMEDDEEYAIWDNGDFGPQKRVTHSIGNLP